MAFRPAAMVLAAGYGTRLRPLTDELPKPLVPVGDRSVLAHLADQLAAARVDRMVLNAHHLAHQYRAILAELALPAQLVEEAGIKGTAGGVRHAAARLGEGAVLVLNGDILARIDLPALIAGHRRNCFATLAVCGELAVGRGTIGLDPCGRVVRLRGETFGQEAMGANFVGVQMLSEAARESLPTEGCLVGDVYLPALRRGAPVVALGVARDFADIGSPQSYLKANLAWLTRRGLPHYLGPGASLGEATSVASVIGAGARVRGRGLIERCVLWPGALADAPLRDAIVSSRGVVVQT